MERRSAARKASVGAGREEGCHTSVSAIIADTHHGDNQSETSLRAGEKRGRSEYLEIFMDRSGRGGGEVVFGGGGRGF